MALEDWVIEGGGRRAGGQGYVEKVRHRTDGRIGALKRLHGEASKQTERRYRFLTEVGGLRAMSGNGVPHVLEANESQWENKEAELYLVMEFIDGPTMLDLVQSSPPTVDEALEATARIVDVLGAGHKLSLHHRDLKPDNVILRGGRWGDAVLVDLGIAWHGQAEDVGFQTPDGRELGNRFLRLPEFAPDGEHRDARSDLAMAAGLLFYMLAGKAPRVLVDYQGRHPHEVEPSPIRPAVLEDVRWPRISAILRVSFQQRLEARFRDADEFASRLAHLNAADTAEPDDLEAELARLEELSNSAVQRERTEAAPAMEQASRELCAAIAQIWSDAGLQWAGQNATFKNGGATCEFNCLVSRRGQSDPYVILRHQVILADGRVTASWGIDDGPSGQYHEGPAADAEGLLNAAHQVARYLAGVVIRAYRLKATPGADLRPFGA
jgi:serine/threonine-protein kinase